ncbi:hypothetical protein B0T37_12470 [Chromobacterium violaceum]|nr:hypothetical protein B0T38_12865 [Chromobacterium violaceum]OQS26089.1 hypothetical protein B0T37_12470 [Chromobacterium violaceum]
MLLGGRRGARGADAGNNEWQGCLFPALYRMAVPETPQPRREQESAVLLMPSPQWAAAGARWAGQQGYSAVA